MEDIVGFAESVNGEFVAGCLLATVDGKRQYLHRDGVFTPEGLLMYQKWEQEQQEPDKAIATERSRVPRKPDKVVVEAPKETPAKE